MPMDDAAFERLAGAVLRGIAEAIEDAAFDGVEAELAGAVLTIETGRGDYVVNKHAPMKQIWLSSPLSGAGHFEHDEATGLWRDTRGGADLMSRLGREIAEIAGVVNFSLGS